jgi:AcrR family transcriptional regulator
VAAGPGASSAAPEPRGRPGPRRSDGKSSAAAVLEAATGVLNERPDASLDDIAGAAGVSRQTVYAHFGSRQALLEEVTARVMGETLTALRAARLDAGPPAAALARLLDVAWQVTARYPLLFRLPATGPGAGTARHQAIAGLLEDLIRRGQAAGDFDPELSPRWLLAGTLALENAASEQVRAGRMQPDEAAAALRRSVLRLFGVAGPARRDPATGTP